ncbi:MAG: SPFH domain-containing protein [Lachnospiraceae bacterium]|nr:SPFH domain-containing protein [Lachnospiraceae bacterium]
MGLIKAVMGAGGGVLADQWREYFVCDSMPADVLLTKGEHRVQGRSTNTKGSDNIITNGSVIAVNEGQCMIIVDQGKIVEVCAEAGEFTYDTSTEPSIFYGGLGKGLLDSFKTFGKRITFGGDTAKDQRIYFVNTKDIIGNKYGTPSPVPFRVVDNNVGLDVDISIRCHGEYTYHIVDPVLFYTNITGNITEDYLRETLDSQLKSELLTALQPAFAKISEMGIRYSALPGHADDIADALNDVLSDKWGKVYGLEIVTFGVSSVNASEEDEKMIKELQRNGALRNPNMAAAHLVGAQAEAMQAAANNQNAGPMMAFAGMNMANNAGGMNAGQLFQMGQNQPGAAPAPAPAPAAAAPAPGGWTCECGTTNTGKFCSNCGKPKPEDESWTCECGTANTGKFCSNCGKPKPEGPWKCECGTENTGKFCSNCGKPKP